MPRLIFKCPYIKGGTKSTAEHLGNYVKYMATRNGVERIDPGRSEWPATEKQTAMVEQILRDFPISKEMFEYADYLAAPTRGNASDFITRALEDNYDQTAKRENYLKYIAREVVGAAVVSSELLGEVIEGVETVTGVKALLVLAVAARHLAVVARRVGPMRLWRIPSWAAVDSNRVGRSRLPLEKRLVNSNPLSVCGYTPRGCLGEHTT